MLLQKEFKQFFRIQEGRNVQWYLVDFKILACVYTVLIYLYECVGGSGEKERLPEIRRGRNFQNNRIIKHHSFTLIVYTV